MLGSTHSISKKVRGQTTPLGQRQPPFEQSGVIPGGQHRLATHPEPTTHCPSTHWPQLLDNPSFTQSVPAFAPVQSPLAPQ